MDAGRCVGACAGADGDFPLLEVGEEGVPFLVGGGPVFLAGPGGAAAGDERPVGLDRLGRVDRLVADRGVECSLCPQMIWAMCGGRPLMMASVTKILRKSCGENTSGSPAASVRPVAASALMSSLRMRGGGERPVLAADRCVGTAAAWAGSRPAPARRRRPPAGSAPLGAAEPADDGAEDVGEFGADQQQPFGVGLGRGDLQQRHELAGGGQPVLGDAVVGQLQQLLAADAGQAQDFDRGEGPERFVFFVGQVAPPAGGRCPRAQMLRPLALLVAMTARRSVPSVSGMSAPGSVPRGRLQAACGRESPLGWRCAPARAGREPLAGALIHAGLAVLARPWRGRSRRRRSGRAPPRAPSGPAPPAAHWAMSR